MIHCEDEKEIEAIIDLLEKEIEEEIEDDLIKLSQKISKIRLENETIGKYYMDDTTKIVLKEIVYQHLGIS